MRPVGGWYFVVDVGLECVEAGFEVVGDVVVELEVGGTHFLHCVLNSLEHWFCSIWFGGSGHYWLCWYFTEQCCDLDFELGVVRCDVLEV